MIETRFDYVHGLHVSPKYTAIAHFWLIKEMLNVRDWYFVTDNDGSLKNNVSEYLKTKLRMGMQIIFYHKLITIKH